MLQRHWLDHWVAKLFEETDENDPLNASFHKAPIGYIDMFNRTYIYIYIYIHNII